MEDSSAALSILVIESNPDHAQLIQEVLSSNSIQHQIVTIADGLEALDFLHQRENYVSAARPDLVLLDLNISGKNGREILSEIKTNPQLKRIPIVVLTTSTEEADIFNSYAQQGNCYVIKSFDANQLFQVVKRIEEFWLGIVTLPVE